MLWRRLLDGYDADIVIQSKHFHGVIVQYVSRVYTICPFLCNSSVRTLNNVMPIPEQRCPKAKPPLWEECISLLSAYIGLVMYRIFNVKGQHFPKRYKSVLSQLNQSNR